jgi:hypothetical protein
MKILTATAPSHGNRSTDFNWTDEGEIVWVGSVCATDRNDPDAGCGCGRAFFGLSSHRATTTAEVRDLALSRDDVITALAGYYESAGYGTFSRYDVGVEVDELVEAVSDWDVGTVIERRLDILQPR